MRSASQAPARPSGIKLAHPTVACPRNGRGHVVALSPRVGARRSRNGGEPHYWKAASGWPLALQSPPFRVMVRVSRRSIPVTPVGRYRLRTGPSQMEPRRAISHQLGFPYSHRLVAPSEPPPGTTANGVAPVAYHTDVTPRGLCGSALPTRSYRILRWADTPPGQAA